MNFPFSDRARRLRCVIAYGLLCAGFIGCGERISPAPHQDPGQEPTTGLKVICKSGVGRGPAAPAKYDPLENASIVISAAEGDKIIATGASDANGWFQIELKPGIYRVEANANRPGLRVSRAEPKTIEITAHKLTEVEFRFSFSTQ